MSGGTIRTSLAHEADGARGPSVWLERRYSGGNERRYKYFLLTGREAKDTVKRSGYWQRSRRRAGYRKSIVPTLSVSEEPRCTERWRRRWLRWGL